MRLILCASFGAALLVSLAVAGDTGVRPRPSAADYPVSREAENATIGAALVPADQVKKTLPPAISKKYVVVEVAVYPQTGSAVDVVSLDFALKYGPDDTRHPSTPHDVASAWEEKESPLPGHGPQVHGETGVAYSTGNDPGGGRQRGWSTYEGVAVTNDPAAAPPAQPPYDPYVVEARATEKALPLGKTTDAVAGYLYFPAPAKKHKGDALELRYSRNGATVTLPLPAK